MHLFKEESVDRTRRGTPSDDDHVDGPLNTEPKKDAITRFMDWYNNDRPHMFLGFDNLETLAKAFIRKMPPPGKIVVDQQTGE